ncbi:protein transport protein SEC31 homolog B [Populus alba]|uniref:Protein transport protein SEC31-like B-like n=2 Tax=Populus TaxID=3689 RepID=A0A4V5ZXA5_POPAL|nr:protein transport protein SEC31 homolog B-like [Populus alba]KAJ7012890.1 protein transport protein SEC31 [Populus alba x Populus x berolinensis]TKR58945.1 protein transport protein SEC31-like B-like [Populus alba]
MAAIKSVNRSASVALAPDSPYMAAGTMAGAVDLSFSSSANLEIFKLDFQSEDHDLPVVGECQSSERFNRLAWGRNGSGSDTYGLGLIAGGLVDGNIDILNPLSLIRSEASESALVGHLSRHKGPVRGLEFNSITPNLLASGADDGEICIWDLAAPAEPSHFPPLKGTGSASQGEISYVSWNCRVQHILASTSSNGITVVWDLKKQKPAISFGDSIRRRCSVLQWHPDVATQLVVASDEDGSPSLRLWDMRNIIEPVKEYVGHTKGVIGMSWCPNDSSYLLTCAKDNRTICWDTVTAEIVCELPAGTNWNFDVHWYPRMPGVISASSFDGKIGIYNIEGCSRYTAGDSDFGRAKLRAPKWCERPVGASYGFGGKLVSFRPKLHAAGASEVFLHNLVTEDSLVSRSSEFESAIQNGEKSLLKALCDKKSQESESEDDRETWGFLKVMFEEDGTARTRMLAHLGFSVPIEEKDAVQENGLNQEINAIRLDDTPTDKVGYENNKEATIFSADDGEDFFNNLPSPKADASLAPSGDDLDLGNSALIAEEISQEPETLEESADPSFDDSIQHALVVGDYKGAVAQCISANKIADALVIAHAGGTSLWENTRDQYLKLSASPYLKIVSAMVNNDLLTLVNTRPLKYWKETLALLCTFAPSEEWSMLCNSLASKLIAAGNTLAATLCYICAGNIDKTVEIWSRSLSTESEGKSYIDLLQDLMEKTIVLALASGQKQFSASLCKLVEKYAEILASQGLLTTALEYLKLLGSDDLSPELTIIRDRIALSMEPEKEAKTPAFENTQQQGGSFYGAQHPGFGVADAPHTYYKGAVAQQMNQSVPGSLYSENNQQPIDSSYGRGFGAPSPYQPSPPPPAYQPAPLPQMFVPTPTPQAPETNFAPPPPHAAASQQPTRPFVPANVPMLRNAEQYQQPTLGSQLYPGTANPAYNPVQPPTGSQGPITAQTGAIPGHRMPQAVAPGPAPMGFRPVHSGVAQRPGIGSMQSPSPTQPASLQPAVVPAAPPPTVQTVDTSNVPAHHRPVITTLTRLFKETSEALGGARANPARKREIEDNSRKIGALFAKLNSGDISENASDKLFKLCQALDMNDFSTALQIQVLLTTSEWDECNFWLATLKRMIKTRQGVGVRSS